MNHPREALARHRKTRFLYNLFAAIWLLALPLNYLAMPETNPESLEFGVDHASRRFMMILFVGAVSCVMLGVLMALRRRIPGWFLVLLAAGAGMYIVTGIWVVWALGRF